MTCFKCFNAFPSLFFWLTVTSWPVGPPFRLTAESFWPDLNILWGEYSMLILCISFLPQIWDQPFLWGASVLSIGKWCLLAFEALELCSDAAVFPLMELVCFCYFSIILFFVSLWLVVLIHLWRSAGYHYPALCVNVGSVLELLLCWFPKSLQGRAMSQNQDSHVMGGWCAVNPRITWDIERASSHHSASRPDLIKVRKHVAWCSNFCFLNL